MEPQRKVRYQDKLEKFNLYFTQYSEWLESHPITDLDMNKDIHWVYAIIHVFQNMAELCSDLSAMILKDEQINPKDNYTNYQSLFNQKILSQPSLMALIKINGLRNRVAHEYNGLNYNIAWEAMKEFINNFKKVRGEFQAWLAQH